MDISKTDSNFTVNATFDISGLDIYSADIEPFKIYGLILPEGPDGVFKRIPTKNAKEVSDKVYSLHTHTAGGRVRFKTNSRAIAIFAKMHSVGKMSNFSITGSAGFDMYVNNRFNKTVFTPPFDMSDGYSNIIWLSSKEKKNIEINFPLYSGVKQLLIGLEKGSSVSEPEGYRYNKPIVYYGSSITQGGCASRPGNTYQAVVSRRFNMDFINLGFAGAAKAERKIAEYISGIDMNIFVYDYDHNADNPEMLEKTHKRMFDIIRRKNPTLPIIMMTRPMFYSDDDTEKRANIIKGTYENALKEGDSNVYFIDGVKMMHGFDTYNDGITVDSWHPNDYGFALMAKAVGDTVEKILVNRTDL